jgi:hypothetical protein
MGGLILKNMDMAWSITRGAALQMALHSAYRAETTTVGYICLRNGFWISDKVQHCPIERKQSSV